MAIQKEQINNLGKIIDKCNQYIIDISDSVATNKEIHDFFYDSINEIKSEILIIDSREWKKFDSWSQKYQWSKRIKPDYADKTWIKKIDDLSSILNEVLNGVVVKKEISFSPNDGYRAKKYLFSLTRKVKNKIVIIDPFLDDLVFDYLDVLDENILIELITSDKKKSFKNLFKSFKKDRGNCNAYFNNESHDRYFLIDDLGLYHLGASINTVGKKDFMITEINNPDVKIEIISKINTWKNNGVVIN